MADGVVQQVARQFAQHPFMGPHRRRFGVDAEVEIVLGDQRRQVQRHVAQHRVQPGQRRRGLLAQLLHLGQRQHLVGQLGGAVHRAADLAQRLFGRRISAQGRLHLGLEHGQRRAQLVRCIAHEALLVLQQVVQPLHHAVGGGDQRLQLARCGRSRDGAEVVLGALLQVGAELAHGPRGALHHQHNDEGDGGDQQGLAGQGVPEHLQRQGVAQLQRLGHLDHGHAPAARRGHGLQQHGHAHRLAAEFVVVEIDQGRVGRARRDGAAPHGQLGEAETSSPCRLDTR